MVRFILLYDLADEKETNYLVGRFIWDFFSKINNNNIFIFDNHKHNTHAV